MWSAAEVAVQAHNLEVGGSIPPSATKQHLVIPQHIAEVEWYVKNHGVGQV